MFSFVALIEENNLRFTIAVHIRKSSSGYGGIDDSCVHALSKHDRSFFEPRLIAVRAALAKAGD